MYAFPATTSVLEPPTGSLQWKHTSTATWTESFFDHFNFIFPILSRPQFHFQLENEELNPMLKLAVFLLGCRLNNSIQDVGQEKALNQQFDALSINASHDDMTTTDLSTVQATVIMCWYTYLRGDLHKCYALRHRLSVLVHQLKLDYESPNDKQDMHQTEMKRRAYWVSF
ncbi:transcription factor domain-containing protein, partial [Parasitella parasitica]